MPPYWPTARTGECVAPGCSASSITTAMLMIRAVSTRGCDSPKPSACRAHVESLVDVLPGVRFAVDAYVNFARHSAWQDAVCASLTELFAPEIHKQRLAGWPQHYPWIDHSGLHYFQSRVSLARRDVEFGLAVTLDHFITRAAQERALQILQFKLDVLWQMNDAMQQRYGAHS